MKEKANVNEVAVVNLPAASAGIKDELEDKNLKQRLAHIIKIKEGKTGDNPILFQFHI